MTATLSSTYADNFRAAFCIDGNTDDPGSACITNGERTPWIAIDYGTRVIVETVEIFHWRKFAYRNQNVDVRISEELPTSGKKMFSGGTLLGHFAGPATNEQQIVITGQQLL